MSTEPTFQIASTSSDETEQLGEQIGRNIRGGEVIALASDLGGGKTTFVRGLARGVGSTDKVASPTFTISKVYQAPQCTIYHFDFYRLADAGLVAYELHDAAEDPTGVIVVEWGDVVEDVLPLDRLNVYIARTGDASRTISLAVPSALGYLLEGIC